MTSLYWISILLFVPDSITAAKNNHQDTFLVGSGKRLYLEECKDNFVPYKNSFLRGVKEKFFVTYNNATEADCLKYCCLEKHFDCSSFSYFPALRVCYVMNLTKHDDIAQLVTFNGITHYDKAVPTESTPTLNVTTAPETTSHFEQTTFTEEKILATTAGTTEADASTPDLTTWETTPTKIVTSTPVAKTSSKSDVTTQSFIKPSKVSTKFSKTETTKSPNILTDAAMTTSGAITKEKDVFVFSNEQSSKRPDDSLLPFPHGSPSSKAQCFETCQNGGSCKLLREEIYGKKKTIRNNGECICKPGYYGTYCEKDSKFEAQVGDGSDENPAAAGVPTYGIVIGALGFFIFSLIIAVLAVYVIYRKKTGQYRVKEQRERWNKRTRKNEARRTQSFLCPDQRSPIGSELNFPDVLDSKGTLSTVTSV